MQNVTVNTIMTTLTLGNPSDGKKLRTVRHKPSTIQPKINLCGDLREKDPLILFCFN